LIILDTAEVDTPTRLAISAKATPFFFLITTLSQPCLYCSYTS
jgi:hypothetical protein